MQPKKRLQDATDKGILPVLGTQVYMPIHGLAAAYKDSAGVMAKSIGSLTDGYNGVNNRTSNTKNQNLICCFSTTKSNIGDYV